MQDTNLLSNLPRSSAAEACQGAAAGPEVELSAHANDQLPLCIGVVASRLDTKPKQLTMTWAELRAHLSQPVEYRDEKDGAGWMPVMLRDERKGRLSENVDKFACIVLDVDHGMTFDDAAERLRAVGYEAILHTSFSHSAREDRFRAVLPLAAPATPVQAKALILAMQRVLDGKADPACVDPARFFYLPACPADQASLFRSEHIAGRLLSAADAVAHSVAAAYGAGGDLPPTIMGHSSAESPEGSRARATAVLAPIPRGRRNDMLAALVGACIRKGKTIDETRKLVLAWNTTKLEEPLPLAEVERTLQSVYKTAQRKAALSALQEDDAIAEMNKKYAFLTEPSIVVDLPTCTKQTPEMMRARYSNALIPSQENGKIKLITHFDAWNKSKDRREHLGLTFEPGKPLIVDDRVNIWRRWAVEPHAGDVQPWNDLLDFLFGAGTPERRWVEQWIAYPIQHPGAKLSTAVVIWSSAQGVGKSLLGETVSRLYGEHGRTITAVELHDKFNSWADRTLFVLGEENAGNDRRADADRLKDLITGETMHIERKYAERVLQRNMMNFMFTSNHPNAFHLEIRDRRFGVFAIDEKPREPEFYRGIVTWRNSTAGAAALMHHLLHVDLTGFDPKGHAPETKAKLDMIEHSKTEKERFVTDILSDEFIDHHLGAEVISISALVALFKLEGGSGSMNTSALATALRKQTPYVNNRISYGRARLSVISLRRHEHWANQDGTAWAAEYAKAVKSLAARGIPMHA